jgi:hypothetical protein
VDAVVDGNIASFRSGHKGDNPLYFGAYNGILNGFEGFMWGFNYSSEVNQLIPSDTVHLIAVGFFPVSEYLVWIDWDDTDTRVLLFNCSITERDSIADERNLCIPCHPTCTEGCINDLACAPPCHEDC